jgi:hypothetical protein
MFADTVTVTINSVAKVMVRVNQDGYSSEYRLKETDGEFRLRLRNSSYVDKSRGSKTVNRHNAELVHTLYPVAPAVYPTVRKTYAVFEDDLGDTLATVAKEVVGTLAFLTEANVTKLENWES